VVVVSATLSVFVNAAGPFPGALSIDQEWIDVSMASPPKKPDPKWEYLDKAGHWHAFTRDGKLPTLKEYRKQIPCDGSCGGVCEGEGYGETRWRCRACEKRVRPSFVDDYAGMNTAIPGMTSWTVKVRAADPVLAKFDSSTTVSVRVVGEDRTYFGLARYGDFSMAGDDLTFAFDLHGITELGERAS
jgi:hypothetical protein